MEELIVARVLRDFLTVTDGEMCVRKGDIVQVLKKIDRHWSYGCSCGKFGNIPNQVLTEVDTPFVEDGQELFVASANFSSQQSGDLSFSKGDLLIGLQKVDDNWWHGKLDDRFGIFPVNYVWMLNPVNVKTRKMSQSLKLQALVKMNMTAKLEDEMDLYEGEIVTVTQIIDKNWYRGYCKDRSGTFPSAYVQLIDNPEDVSCPTSNNNNSCSNTSGKSSTPPLILFSPIKENKPPPATTSHLADLTDIFTDDYFKLNMPSMYQQESATKTDHDICSGFEEYGKQNENDNSVDAKCPVQTSVQVDIVSYGLTLYPFYAQFENELSFHEGEIIELIRHVNSLWMEGKIDDRKGIFPTNYINILVDCDERPTVDQEPHSLPDTLAPNSFAVALYNFDAQMNGDLTVRQNQVVLVLEQIDEDWCKVKDQNGNTGLCPRNHLTSHSVTADHSLESSIDERSTNDDHPIKDVNTVKFQRSKSVTMSRTEQPFSSAQQNRFSHSPSSSVASAQPFKRQGSDRMPHRPAPPIPVPGQQPVRRTLQQPALNQAQACSTLFEEKNEKEEPTCSQENEQMLIEEKRKKNQEQRQNVITELVVTEKEYVRDLKITYETFNLHNPSILESRGIDVKTLFGNILEVMHFAETLLDSLMLAMKGKNDEDQCVGPCFLTMCNEMKRVYGQYCVNHDNALALLEKYETNEAIQNLFEKGLETLRYQIACFNMGSILIKPVQRILKYPLILNELIKCTEDCHKDKSTLLEAVRSVTEVATSINEGKRRKDIVCKYLEDGNATIASKMSKLSLHSVAKKSSRLSVMLTSSLGFGNATKDPVFDEYESMFHALVKSVSGFTQNVDMFLSHQHEEIMMQSDVANCISSFYQEANIVAVDQFQATQQLIMHTFWPQFKNMVDVRVLTVLNTLLELFHGPSILVQKRHDKLLDYNGCIAKAEKNKENKLIQEELFSAKKNYEALNSHLLEELPSLIQLSTGIFIECLSAFITARKLLSGKITKQYLSLMENNIIMQFHGDPLESFSVKHSLVLNQMSRFAFTSKSGKTDTLGKRASRASPTPFRNSQDLSHSQVEVTKSPANVNNEPQSRMLEVSPQGHSQRVFLQSRYPANMLHQVISPHVARESLELTAALGHLVAVIKKQNPMGDSSIWFVDDGATKGFIPNSCLTPVIPSGSVAQLAAGEFTTPRTSRSQVNRVAPSIQTARVIERPPTYEEVVNNVSPTTVDHAESSEASSQPLYAEIPDIPIHAEFYYAMFDFASIGPHSLSIKSGQVVNVLRKQDLQGNTEWWLVEDRFGGKGYVPGNFLGKYG